MLSIWLQADASKLLIPKTDAKTTQASSCMGSEPVTFRSLWSVQLVLEVLSKCEGAYGLLIKSAHYPGELVACKRGSPLLLGLKTAARTPKASPQRALGTDEAFEAFIASDASAFVEHTNQCVPCLRLWCQSCCRPALDAGSWPP